MTLASALRAIVIDDEPLAREGLELRLGWLPDVAVIATCGTAAEALAAFRDLNPDVAFIDVQMPELDGFAVLDRVERDLLPAVIFVTAHAEHALRAFRVGAFDYLLKPFDDATLRATVERARTFVAVVRGTGETGGSGAGGVAGDGDGDGQSARVVSLERITVRHQGRVAFIDPAAIDWVEAAGDNVRIHVARDAHLFRSTMRAMEERLDPSRFVRVHRGAIVALHLIRELQPYSRGEHLVVLADGTKLPLSRRFRRRVEEALAGDR